MPEGFAEKRNPRWHRGPTDPAGNIVERRIATKQFVAAETRYGRFEPDLPNGLADEPGIDAIDRRLVHRVENLRQIGAKLHLRNDAHRMSGAISVCDHARQ